ncbi:hypothetical protein [Mycolicibacterium septicum]|uniref:hypothetical protein n=1 Tax=Mycolicibacterium septicum TaxID=98668 RepID=UPI001AF2FF86|nr:hypothetical protein [Mycolicibacterium septicum]QRY51763.1 hypothetical protein JVX95_31055 [Mycolicibacterium septicum]
MSAIEIGKTVIVNHERWHIVGIRMQGTWDYGTNTRVSLERFGNYRSVIIPKANFDKADIIRAMEIQK